MSTVKSRKKRVSKKLKVTWRKHVDIHDVEEFLEDQRLEERLGISLSTISDNDLFKVDTEPSVELLSSKQRRKLKANKPLKCFSALQPNTNVPDPVIKRNRVKSKEERKNELIKKKEIENRAKGIVKHKDIQANANRKLNEIQRKSKPKRGEFSCDLWESDKVFDVDQDIWTCNNTKKHNLRGVGIAVKNVMKTVRQKTSMPAIEIPHPGMSYNPSFTDHQDLLKIVAENEMQLINEEEHLTRCTKDMFQKVSAESKNATWLVEMSEGLPSKCNADMDDQGDMSDNEYKSINPPVRNSKKTVKQRRKQREQLELARQNRLLKLEKQKVTDIHRLNILSKKIEILEKKYSILQEKRKRKSEERRNRTKVLSSMKFVDPDLEFTMGQEIAGNLKNLKVEGNLLLDRFKSMQKRNILVPTKRHIRKKVKVKRYTKPGHKDEDWKKTVAH